TRTTWTTTGATRTMLPAGTALTAGAGRTAALAAGRRAGEHGLGTGPARRGALHPRRHERLPHRRRGGHGNVLGRGSGRRRSGTCLGGSGDRCLLDRLGFGLGLGRKRR